MTFIRHFRFLHGLDYSRPDKDNLSEIIHHCKNIPEYYKQQYDYLVYIINTVIYIKLI